MRSAARHRAPGLRYRILVAILLSAGVHGALGVAVVRVFSVPALDIDLQVPVNVELGLSDEVAMAGSPGAPSPTPSAPQSAEPGGAAGAAGAPPAAPKPQKMPRKRPRTAPDVADAGPDGDGGVTPDGRQVGARLPPGAQIALRLDMTRIRNSPLSEDVRALVSTLPDWKALLEGSGVDAVDQLDRLLLATPNLKRENIVLAGRFIGDRNMVEGAVARLAEARGVEAPFHPEGDVEVAQWLSADETPRVIALLGGEHFVISRTEDLPRVLAIAAARAERRSRGGPTEHPAEALLAMDEGEAMSLEVEGVARFVRRAPRSMPESLRLSVVETAGARLLLRARLVFADAGQAEDGRSFWESARETYSRNALVALMGLAAPLREAKLELSGAEVRASMELNPAQARLILGYVRGLLTPPASPAP